MTKNSKSNIKIFTKNDRKISMLQLQITGTDKNKKDDFEINFFWFSQSSRLLTYSEGVLP
jgi:hypothetical protein